MINVDLPSENELSNRSCLSNSFFGARQGVFRLFSLSEMRIAETLMGALCALASGATISQVTAVRTSMNVNPFLKSVGRRSVPTLLVATIAQGKLSSTAVRITKHFVKKAEFFFKLMCSCL